MSAQDCFVTGIRYGKMLPRRKAGAPLPALGRRIGQSRLSPGKRSGSGFIRGGSAAPAGGQLAVTALVIARSAATKQSAAKPADAVRSSTYYSHFVETSRIGMTNNVRGHHHSFRVQSQVPQLAGPVDDQQVDTLACDQAWPHRCGRHTARRSGDLRQVYGFMRGSVVAPGGFDFTASTLDEPLSADQGHIHE